VGAEQSGRGETKGKGKVFFGGIETPVKTRSKEENCRDTTTTTEGEGKGGGQTRCQVKLAFSIEKRKHLGSCKERGPAKGTPKLWDWGGGQIEEAPGGVKKDSCVWCPTITAKKAMGNWGRKKKKNRKKGLP